MLSEAATEEPVGSSPQHLTCTSRNAQTLRVALACSGIGHVNRGYEASVAELFQAIKDRVDVQLYRGNGSGPGVRSLTTIRRRSLIYRMWPLQRLSEYARYRNENLSFAIHFVVCLFFRPVDIVFTPDHILALTLKKIRRFLPRRPTVVFSNGAPFENEFCAKFEAVHQKSFEHFAQARGTDLQERSWLIANGFSAERLQQPSDFSRSETLNQFDIDPETTVVLALSAHDISHKRVDWLLSEFSRLDQNQFTLIVAGQPTGDSESLRDQARNSKCNVRFVTVPQQDVPGLIWSSDMMVLCSLSEGFPRSVAESMGGRRHIFVHPHENAKWIIGDNKYCFVDMERQSALAEMIQHAAEHPALVAASATRNHQRFLDNFTWQRVAESYEKLFLEVMQETRSKSSSGIDRQPRKQCA